MKSHQPFTSNISLLFCQPLSAIQPTSPLARSYPCRSLKTMKKLNDLIFLFSIFNYPFSSWFNFGSAIDVILYHIYIEC